MGIVIIEKRTCDLFHNGEIVEPSTTASITVGDEKVEWEICGSHATTIKSWMQMKRADLTPVKSPAPAVAAPARTRRTVKKAVTKRAASNGKATAPKGYSARQVREWAAANGVDAPKNGRLPNTLVEKYLAATSA